MDRDQDNDSEKDSYHSRNHSGSAQPVTVYFEKQFHVIRGHLRQVLTDYDHAGTKGRRSYQSASHKAFPAQYNTTVFIMVQADNKGL